MAWVRLWIVAYDVADPKRLRRVAKTVEAYGTRQQKSVFEAALNSEERQRLQHQLAQLVHSEEDSVLLHPCCARCRSGIRWQGRAPGPDHEPFWIV